MELVFVRHGQPAWDRDGLSVTDPELTDLGHEQARHLVAAFADRPVDRLLVSPLVRAQQTAVPLAEGLGLVPETLPWLPEIAAPAWDGTPSEVVEKAFADGRARPLEEQWDGLPGGESFRDFHERITSGLVGLLGELGVNRLSEFPAVWDLSEPGPRVVVVAHAGTNAVCLGHLLGIEAVPWEWERFVSFHASTTVVRPLPVGGVHSFSLFRFSDTSHLPRNLQTT
jgi:broad specificity phosphatase PhoE